MLKKTDLKMAGVVALGVFVAGYAMHMLKDVQIVDDARKGFGG